MEIPVESYLLAVAIGDLVEAKVGDRTYVKSKIKHKSILIYTKQLFGSNILSLIKNILSIFYIKMFWLNSTNF